MALSDTLYELGEEIDIRIRDIRAYLDPSWPTSFSEQIRTQCNELLTVLADAKARADRIRLQPGLDLPP